MLDSDTKRRINTCRDILVGKVPDPKSQVEQITIALIYKFMEDMDLESEELGGARKFFTGDFQRYSWSKLMASGLSGQEMLNTYSEALDKMVENEKIPELFRTIFRNAYLPYRDPETLRSFLREINGFSYDHSERLGDAFEYLLSVLGSQGDAGQFRTPRHIIDFMVEIIDPKKDEVILDPACGTAGFLISSYKHILKANTTEPKPLGDVTEVTDAAEAAIDNPKRYSGDLLTTDDRKRLANNIKGYDISPDMVRLSLVNLYLHGFLDPKVEEYDTLTSEDKWGETADVILANPPFMSPKGGIKPHTKFSIASKRSEVLFVDYIAEHLTPKGRAAIVVPEGIIFQSQSAYVELRKTLVEKYLAAVISLPAGVFNPYSGVKTSILILDAAVAKASDSVAFFKIENDGFGLGAQRKAVKGTQLPQAKAELSAWLNDIRGGGEFELTSPLGFAVKRARIGEDRQFNLSGERYRETEKVEYDIPRVAIGEVCTINPRKSEIADKPAETVVSFAPMATLNEHRIGFTSEETKLLSEVGASYTYFADGDVLLAKVTPCFENGKAGIAQGLSNGVGFGSSEFYVLRPGDEVLAEWVYRCVMHPSFRAPATANMTGTGGLQRVPRDFVERFQIPLPPIEVQREIVAEIETYQKVIDGARTVIENYRPQVPVDPNWEVEKLGALATIASGGTPSKERPDYWEGQIPWVSPKDMKVDYLTDTEDHLSAQAVEESATRLVEPDTVLCVVRSGILKHTLPVALTRKRMCFNQDIVALIPDHERLLPDFLLWWLKGSELRILAEGIKPGVTVQSFHSGYFKSFEIPTPPIETQRAIVAEIEAERALVDANRELIARFEKKIEATIARVWGEGEEGVAA